MARCVLLSAVASWGAWRSAVWFSIGKTTVYAQQSGQLGDVNGDGEVNGLDVDPFVDLLLNGPYQTEADMNQDMQVNGLDVDPFVAAVVGGGTQQIPEPSTLLLCVIALGLVGRWRQWGGVSYFFDFFNRG